MQPDLLSCCNHEVVDTDHGSYPLLFSLSPLASLENSLIPTFIVFPYSLPDQLQTGFSTRIIDTQVYMPRGNNLSTPV